VAAEDDKKSVEADEKKPAEEEKVEDKKAADE